MATVLMCFGGTMYVREVPDRPAREPRIEITISPDADVSKIKAAVDRELKRMKERR